jgi:hypothetical protein
MFALRPIEIKILEIIIGCDLKGWNPSPRHESKPRAGVGDFQWDLKHPAQRPIFDSSTNGLGSGKTGRAS